LTDSTSVRTPTANSRFTRAPVGVTTYFGARSSSLSAYERVASSNSAAKRR
jgi:hypothetical protein